ncbi:hypothetical protein PFISCL1PPCAC_6225, partial [Pristionchus fissidentatus]
LFRMERHVAVPLPTGTEQVVLVAGRTDGDSVSTRENERVSSDELVVLAGQLKNARELVRGRALDRMHDIAKQMEHLHEMAKKVLEDANRDEHLHKIACNMQKIVGKVYHVYDKEGNQYMSLLSPDEWGRPEKLEEFRGSYRLEADRSWTPLDEVREKEEKRAKFERYLLGTEGNLKISYK